MNRESDSVSQPVIGCIGHSVAGQPTQFLLERAFASLSLDWRALSVEVAPEKFEVACEGMLAMGFKGLRVFPDYQQRAVQTLASQDPAASFVGRLTSGIPATDHWKMWDHCGHAWLNLLSSGAGQRPPVIWLHGDSSTTRSLFVALTHQRSAGHWLWTQAPELTESTKWPVDVEPLKSEGRILGDLSSSTATVLQRNLTQGASEAKEQSPTQLALVTEHVEITDAAAQQLGDLASDQIELVVPQSLRLSKSLGNCGLRRIGESELAVAAETYDFLRWTGHAIDSALLRDAYDEYCDF